MSTCVSRAGEFSEHIMGESGADFTCARCWVFDEDAALAALSAARADAAAARAETQRVKDAVEGLRALSEAATAGRWESMDNGDRLVAWGGDQDPFGERDDTFAYVVEEPMHGPDAALIAAAVNLVRAVLDGEQ